MTTWQPCFWVSSSYPMLGRTRSRGRCWAAIWLSHRPEPSGRAVHEVDGLDIEGQHGRRFVLLRHTRRPQRRPYPIRTSRSGNVRHGCGGGWTGPRLFLVGSFREGGRRCCGWKYGVLWVCPPTPHPIGDPPSAPHVCCCCQINWWVVVRRVQIGVSIWGVAHLHSIHRWALSWAGVQAPWHGVLRTVPLHCVEAQQIGCLRGLEGCPLV